MDAGNASRVFKITAGGTVTLTALVLQNGRAASGNGGAVLAGAGPLVLSQVQVLNSTAPAGRGGGLFSGATATLTGTQFISNTSSSHAGGLWVEGNAVVTNGRFERNRCTGSGCKGGGLNVDGLTLTDTQFISNTSAGQGSGAWANSAALLTTGSFQGNKCTDSGCLGGGLFAFATLTLTGTQFISNSSPGNGGVAFAQGAAVLTNGQFQVNECTDSGCLGGGLDVSSTLTLTGTDFISNTSAGQGGGAFAQGAALLTTGSFHGNKCTDSGCFGGGLFANTTLTLTGTDFISNTSTRAGGGAYANAAAVLTNAQFQGNRCTQNTGLGCNGGGLAANDTLTLTGTEFISNTSTHEGGGANVGHAAVLTNSQFQGNKCSGSSCQGGGLWGGDSLTLTGTDFISNTSTSLGGGAFVVGAALLTNGQFQVNECTDSGCLGGGLYADSTALVRGSSFSGNQSAGSGGAVGITNTAQITLANVTLSGNLATVSGGGLYAGGTSRAGLWNVTVADNQAPSGSGVGAALSATLGLTNTLLSNNSGGNCSGLIAAGTHNLEWPGGTCATAGPTAGFTSADPQLAPLALNSPGTTFTHTLLPGSPARDAGDPVSCANALVNNVDQRGSVRPDVGGEACDIGAYEAGPPDWLVLLPLVRK